MVANVSLAAPHRLSAKIPFSVITFQYADDTVLIASTKGSTLRLLLLVIHCFTEAFGLKVNYDKSLFVPLSIQQRFLCPIEQLLQCRQSSFPITYLGMPLTIKKPTRIHYLPLLEKLEKRLQGWKARLISRAGKLQLVKTVLSTIPTYFMSCFKFPKWLLARIDVIRRQFLWSRNENSRAIHLINWQIVCLPIQCGGMGVVNLHLQNISLLLRWLWRLYAINRKLWATYATMIYASRPNQDGPLILSTSGSFFWNSLLKLRPLFSSSTKFHICSGKRISYWFDTWAGQPLANLIEGPVPNRNISLFEARQRMDLLFPRPLTYQFHRASEKLTTFTPTHGVDSLTWTLTASGLFSVKSLYKILSQGGKIRSSVASIWRTAVTPSMKVLFFLLLNNRLLTHEVMLRRNLPYQMGCVMCDRAHTEDAMHLFFRCTYASQIWLRLSTVLGYNVLTIKESVMETYRCSQPMDKAQRRVWATTFITTAWILWRERNERTFRNGRTPPRVLANRVQQEADLLVRLC